MIAGLLTLILRKNHARARYGLWLAASVKLLIPFSLLIGIGSHLARPHAVAQTEPGFLFTMQEVSQPFTKAATQAGEKSRRPAQDAGLRYRLAHLLPAILVAMWFCGFVAVLFVWYARWRRISSALREAAPLREGREVEALRRLERRGGIRKPIELLLSPASLEPGIFGIVKPVLVWPKGFSEHLQDAHLETILAHEVWHVLRRDNLAAAIHMVVEALFWFHPLVWWLGARLMDERERACDEEVLESGSERKVYAEGILKTCEFYLESRLACMSGVTGADLKKRIVRIMTERSARKLDFRRRLLLGVAGLAVVALPVIFGAANAPQSAPSSQSEITLATPPRFETVSIKLYESDPPGWRLGHTIADPPTEGAFNATDVSVEALVQLAYGVHIWCPWMIQGGPSWFYSEKFDIEAKASRAVNDELRVLSSEQGLPIKHRMLQALLAERFKLTLHRETKNLPEYVLVIGKNGPKVQESPTGVSADDVKGPGGKKVRFGPGQLRGDRLSMPLLAELLSVQLGCPVLDQTELKGTYDFTLEWTPDQDHMLLSESSRSSLFAAIQEQLGLKLESTKGPVEVLVIDHVERPSEN